MSAIVPISRDPITVRPATLDDLAFMDGLQKQHSKQLGYFPTKQFEGYIAMGGVLIAESDGARVGYCVSRDRYLKRDELGVIFQLCVAPGEQRKLVGAELIRTVFERSAYGCKLYCCWCAQDIEANRFWESLGFLPIAFRAGGSGGGCRPQGKGCRPQARVHIFWQRRIREGDMTTPYWFPSQTNAGAIREDRLVFPIPPGTHWSEVKAIVLPSRQPALPDSSRSRKSAAKKPADPASKALCGFAFQLSPAAKSRAAKAKREKKPKPRSDPRFVAAARELRDRWLEHVNADPSSLLAAGKYDVARAISDARKPAAALPSPQAA